MSVDSSTTQNTTSPTSSGRIKVMCDSGWLVEIDNADEHHVHLLVGCTTSYPNWITDTYANSGSIYRGETITSIDHHKGTRLSGDVSWPDFLKMMTVSETWALTTEDPRWTTDHRLRALECAYRPPTGNITYGSTFDNQSAVWDNAGYGIDKHGNIWDGTRVWYNKVAPPARRLWSAEFNNSIANMIYRAAFNKRLEIFSKANAIQIDEEKEADIDMNSPVSRGDVSAPISAVKWRSRQQALDAMEKEMPTMNPVLRMHVKNYINDFYHRANEAAEAGNGGVISYAKHSDVLRVRKACEDACKSKDDNTPWAHLLPAKAQFLALRCVHPVGRLDETTIICLYVLGKLGSLAAYRESWEAVVAQDPTIVAAGGESADEISIPQQTMAAGTGPLSGIAASFNRLYQAIETANDDAVADLQEASVRLNYTHTALKNLSQLSQQIADVSRPPNKRVRQN